MTFKLPWDNHFVWNCTQYKQGALDRLCHEFGIEAANPDFRLKGQSTDSGKFNFHYKNTFSDSLTAITLPRIRIEASTIGFSLRKEKG